MRSRGARTKRRKSVHDCTSSIRHCEFPISGTSWDRTGGQKIARDTKRACEELGCQNNRSDTCQARVSSSRRIAKRHRERGNGTMLEPITGRCACGAVEYECDGEPVAMLNCHCRDCQRASGSAYAAIL